eukprot:3817967-Alexandrium_andersonii.AAC.1
MHMCAGTGRHARQAERTRSRLGVPVHWRALVRALARSRSRSSATLHPGTRAGLHRPGRRKH